MPGVAQLDLPAEVADDVGEGAGVVGVAPLSSRARTRRPLVALLKWLTTLRRDRHLVEHPHGRHLAREVAAGPPERGVGGRPQVDDAARCRRPRGRPGRAPARQCAETTPRPGRFTPPARRYGGIRSPGRTSPKSEEVTASQRRGAAAGGAVEECEVEGLVEHAGVDRVGARGRGARAGARCGVPHRPGSAQPERPGGALGIAGAETDQRRRAPARAVR